MFRLQPGITKSDYLVGSGKSFSINFLNPWFSNFNVFSNFHVY